MALMPSWPRLLTRAALARELQRLKLSSETSAPTRWDESNRWRRIVERYPWGFVVLTLDRQEARECTCIITGQFDTTSGKVLIGGKPARFPARWYGELAAFFERRALGSIELPRCFGHHENDATCDGGRNQAGFIEPPCSWRDRCVKLISLANAAKKQPGEVVAGLEPHEIVELTGPAATAQLRVVKRPRPTVSGEASAVVAQLWMNLRRVVEPRPCRMREEEAGVGELFMVDRMVQSNYVAIYCQPVSGRKIPVAQIHLRRHDVHVRLPLAADHPLLRPLARHVIAWGGGTFQSAIKNVPAQVSSAAVCGVIAKAIASQAIPVPRIAEYERRP